MGSNNFIGVHLILVKHAERGWYETSNVRENAFTDGWHVGVTSDRARQLKQSNGFFTTARDLIELMRRGFALSGSESVKWRGLGDKRRGLRQIAIRRNECVHDERVVHGSLTLYQNPDCLLIREARAIRPIRSKRIEAVHDR